MQKEADRASVGRPKGLFEEVFLDAFLGEAAPQQLAVDANEPPFAEIVAEVVRTERAIPSREPFGVYGLAEAWVLAGLADVVIAR